MRLSSLVRLIVTAALAAIIFVVLVPGCGRSSLESESLDGGTITPPPPGGCNPQTCPTGCCDSAGQCRLGSDTRACGQQGNLCSDCLANGFDTCGDSKTCSRTGCANCNGCCDRNGGVEICRAGADPTACGRFGGNCTNCAQQGRDCDPKSGTCSTGKCDASNCQGCCIGDKCLSGVDQTACGQFGQACDSCASRGQKCNPSTLGGGTCQGNPTCGPANCGGCCNGTTCTGGGDNSACGKSGAACKNCSAIGDICVPNGQPNERTCQPQATCGPGNCAGCCVGNTCITNETNAACGSGGQACKACAPNETCSGNACVPNGACNPGNCPGCCVGNICAIGTQDTACGTGGKNCQNCVGGGQVCNAGICSAPACGPGTCPNGCCNGNVCVVGTQDNACGSGGKACDDCNAGGQKCQGRVCKDKCGPANCAGCCTAADACAPGVANNNCGGNGAACQNCTVNGSLCDINQAPPACSAANTCPSAYPGCGAGVTTAVTTQNQNVCSDVDLAALRDQCPNGASDASCIAAYNILKAVDPACATCVGPFNVDFVPTFEGIFLCASPFVGNNCRHQMGCDFDCTTVSCNQCLPAQQTTCENNVQNAGQCSGFANQAFNCIFNGIGPGQPGEFCDPGQYASYGEWLFAVGKKFCGGP